MEPIKIPVTLSPHYGDKGPKGFYILAQRLWPEGAPILNKVQWVGYFGTLIVTVQHPGEWNSLLKKFFQIELVYHVRKNFS